MLKQELARLRAGSNGSAAPAAPDKGKLSIACLEEYPCHAAERADSCQQTGKMLQLQKSVPALLLTLKIVQATLLALHAWTIRQCNHALLSSLNELSR